MLSSSRSQWQVAWVWFERSRCWCQRLLRDSMNLLLALRVVNPWEMKVDSELILLLYHTVSMATLAFTTASSMWQRELEGGHILYFMFG